MNLATANHYLINNHRIITVSEYIADSCAAQKTLPNIHHSPFTII
jgi:hypothetical protein